jgi:predicted nuclease of predicted toxin-antitoxin system
VKFLIDANLPPAYAQWLISQGHDAFHVSELNLETAPDRDIWRRARDLNACIVTKDEDFVLLHAIDQAGPHCLDTDWQRGAAGPFAATAGSMAGDCLGPRTGRKDH